MAQRPGLLFVYGEPGPDVSEKEFNGMSLIIKYPSCYYVGV